MGGDGWSVTGAGWNINPNHDMSYEWMKDTVQFKYKTAKFSGNNIRLQYEAGSGKLVKEVDIIPIEIIMRKVAAGSICKRLGLIEGKVLPKPLIEFCLKNEIQFFD